MNKRLKRFQESNIIEDLELGILSEGAFRKYVRYLRYCDYIKQGLNKTNAVQSVAEDSNISFTSVWNAVEFFEGDIKKPDSIDEKEVQFFRNTSNG